MLSRSDKSIVYWLFSGCFLVFLMVLIGGITRLTHSGLSITEWNLIMGTIPPMNTAEWTEAFAKYQQTPEFVHINYSMTLEEFKSIFFWEYLHRLIGRLIGFVFLIPFCYFLYKKQLSKKLTIKLLGVFFLGGLQGLIGWYMVASGLVKDPHVSHYRLATHLITAFITFGYIFWLALDIIYPVKNGAPKKIKIFSVLVMSVVIVQIIYGALVAGLKAGLIYNTWPTMGGEMLPEAVTSMNPIWKNFLENMSGVQFSHRLIAYTLCILILWLYIFSRKMDLTSEQAKGIKFLLIVLGVQFTLGVLTLLYAVPITLGILHQLGAFFLFATAVFFMHRTAGKAELAKV